MKAAMFFFTGLIVFIASILIYVSVVFGTRAFDMLLGAILGSVVIMVVAGLTIFTVLAIQRNYANDHKSIGESDVNRVQALSKFGVEVLRMRSEQQNTLPMLPPITDADYEMILNDEGESNE